MYRFELRNSFIKKVSAGLPASVYHYEPDLDPEVIEGRLLVNVYLYAHVNHCGEVFTTPQHMLDYLGVDSGKQNWRASVGTRIVDKGLQWMIRNGYAGFKDESASSILDYTYRDHMIICVNDSLFDMYCDDLHGAQPYIRVYQNDIEKILSASNAKTYKLFRIYCYIRSCMRNAPPYGWVVTYQEIENATGYSHKYVVGALQVLCDELGVLHRQQLRRIGTKVPPYCYIFNVDGWEQYLHKAINKLYKVSDDDADHVGADNKNANQLQDGGGFGRIVAKEDLPPDIRQVMLRY